MKSLIFGVNNIKVEKSGESVELGKIAIWNEYGTKNIPPRPAFRMGLEAAMNTRKPNIQAFLKNLSNIILTGQVKARQSELDQRLKVLLTGIGQSAVKETKDIIKAGSTTPNAPSTVRRKGFNHPLYHKGLLLENVAYEVIDE
jgi:hypothetical protein